MGVSPLFRTAFTAQASGLRASLLLSLGLSPLSCGGVTAAGNADSGSARAGSGNQAGTAEGGASAQDPASNGGAGTAGAGPALSCDNPTLDPRTRLVSCQNGLRHRAQALACDYIHPPAGEGGAAGDGGAPPSGGASADVPCTSSSDCRFLPRGYCQILTQARQVCRSGCITDEDCNGGVCACNGFDPGRCTEGDCRIDEDCGPGRYCAPVEGDCVPDSFHCMTLQDECSTDADCAERDRCRLENGRHLCVSGAVCGRPFLVADAPRVAAVELRSDWLEATLTTSKCDLSPIQRAQLAAHWARLGQMEHASIAAFARFNLQLLALGAPSTLVEACNRALSDETSHARICFAFASAYGDAPLGPAPLDIARCCEQTSLTEIAKLVLREGCLGETIASLEALAQSQAASEPAVKQALAQIAADELRHAELAFAFLRWALSRSSETERRELAREAEQRLAELERAAEIRAGTPSAHGLGAHGVLETAELGEVQLAALRELTQPLLSALFELPAASSF